MMQVQSSSLIGVAIACTGNILISLALTVQKLAHQRIHSPAPSSSSSPSPSPRSSSPSPQSSPVPSPPPLDVTSLSHVTPARVHALLPVAPDERSVDGAHSETDVEVVPILVVPSGAAKDSPERHVRVQPPTPDPNTDYSERAGGSDDDSSDDDECGGGDDGDAASGRKEPPESAYLKSKLWWLGLVMIAVGEGGNFLSYGFAPASVVAPLGTVALIANCVFAPLILKESFNRKNLVGVALAIVGAVTVVMSSNDTNPRLTAALLATPFLVYTLVVLLLILPLAYLSSLERYGARYILIDLGVCALFGGYTVMSTKALSSLLSTLFLAALRWPVTWVALAVLATTSVAQVWYLNRALMRFESKQVIPTQFVLFSMSVLYQEFRGLTFSRSVNFAFGIATTFSGVYFLTSPHTSPASTPHASAPPSPSPPDLRRLASISEDTPLLLPPPASAASPRRLVARRASSSSLFPPGLSSQAGLLLLATTPPGAGYHANAYANAYGTVGLSGQGAALAPAPAAAARARSASRASRESDDGRRGSRRGGGGGDR